MAINLNLNQNLERLPSEGKQAPLGKLTYEEFLAWADDKTFAEWVDGDVQIMSPVSRPHQELALFLSRLLAEFCEEHDAGQILNAPFQMRFIDAKRGREPDVLFLLKANLSRLAHTYLDGPADIVIEIVSPESILRDREEKFGEYEREGVPEYWMIDPMTQSADFFVLSSDGRYQNGEVSDAGIYRSTILPGFWVNVNWFWQRPLPMLRQIIREWESN